MMNKKRCTNKKVIYPGSFDPITNGHLNIITRAASLFDKLVLAISTNSNKNYLFNLNDRVSLAKEVVSHLSNVEVVKFNGLIIDLMRDQQTNILIRSLRTVTDFEYEMQLAHMNNFLMPELESIYFMSSVEWSFVSSSLIKDIAYHRGDISHFLPSYILQMIKKKLNQDN